jgi:hypothetical protein
MATIWDMTVARGCTDPLIYPITLGGAPDVLSGFTDIRWYAKFNKNDADGVGLLKTFLAGQVTVSGTNILVTLNVADTAAPALTPGPGTLVLYLDLVVFIAGSPEVKYSLFRDTNGVPLTPTLTLYQTVGLAVS